MNLISISIFGFRNLLPTDITFEDRLNLVMGANGAGKTSLVEAIYFLASLKSFRTSRSSEVITHGLKGGVLSGVFETEKGKKEVKIEIGDGFRKAYIDGHGLKSARVFLEAFPVVCLSPDNRSLLDGGPDARREILDHIIVVIEPSAINNLTIYQRCLKTRNLILRQEQGTWNMDLLGSCEEILSKTGIKIIEIRKRILGSILNYIGETLEKILNYKIEIDGEYISSIQTAQEDQETLRNMLQKNREKDAILGYTSVGPHVDDFTIYMARLKAKSFASRGQKKLVEIAWKLAESLLIENEKKERPILILDDALSDLDQERQTCIMKYLYEREGQTFLTCAYSLDAFTFPYIRVSSGRVAWVRTGG